MLGWVYKYTLNVYQVIDLVTGLPQEGQVYFEYIYQGIDLRMGLPKEDQYGRAFHLSHTSHVHSYMGFYIVCEDHEVHPPVTHPCHIVYVEVRC